MFMANSAASSEFFLFDPIPRVIDAETWAELEAGLIQRVRALNAFVGDVYGAGAIMNDGIIPRDLILELSAISSGRGRDKATAGKLRHHRGHRYRARRRPADFLSSKIMCARPQAFPMSLRIAW